MTEASNHVQRWNAQDSLWLCLAIVLHAMLLLPALPNDHATTGVVPLNITLFAPVPLENPFIDKQELNGHEIPVVKDKTAPPEEHPISKFNTLEEREDRPGQDLPGNETLLTTARLLESASDIKLPVPAKNDPGQLGIFLPHALPENWRSGRIIGDDILHPMVLPGKTEIVDRWLTTDGSRNVLVNTRDGHRFCGRALAWDPMQPLVEHVMQFRLCGGDEKRTSEMTQRIKRLTSSPL